MKMLTPLVSWKWLSAALVAGGLFLLQAQAAPITALKLTFDNDGPTGADTGEAANPYRMAVGDIKASEIESINRVGGGGIPTVVNSTGPQGGLALSLNSTMTGAGYQAADDVAVNILFRSISYEAMVNVTSGNIGTQSLFFQANGAGTTLGFNAQNLTFNDITYDFTSNFDQWVHLGATVSWDGTNRITNLYINNTLVGTTTTTSGQGLLGFGNLFIGYKNTNNQFGGLIDAVAVSTSQTAGEVLGPGSFLLPVPVPEPSTVALLALGGVGLVFWRVRARAA